MIKLIKDIITSPLAIWGMLEQHLGCKYSAWKWRRSLPKQIQNIRHWEDVKHIKDQYVLKEIILTHNAYQSEDFKHKAFEYLTDQKYLKEIVLEIVGMNNFHYKEIAINKIMNVTWLKEYRDGKYSQKTQPPLPWRIIKVNKRLKVIGNSVAFITD